MWDIVSTSSVILAFLAIVLTYLNYKILVITKEMLSITVGIKYKTDELLRVTKKTYTSISGDLDK